MALKRGKIKNKLSIRNKLVILFMVIALLPILLGYVTLLLSQNSMMESARTSFFSQEEGMAKLVDQYVVDCQKVIIDAAYQPTVIEGMEAWNGPKLRNRFSSIFRRYKNFTFIVAEDRRGVVKAVYPNNESLLGKKLSAEAGLSTVREGISDVFSSNYIRDFTVAVVFSPVKSRNGRVLGTLIGGIDLKTLSILLDKVKPHSESYVYLVDRKGIVITHPEERMLLSDLSENTVIKKLLQNGTGIEKDKDSRGKSILSAFKLAPLAKWGVVLNAPEKRVYAILIKIKRFLIVLSLLGLAVAMYFSLKFSSMITQPIHQLQHGAEMIGAGNLNYRLSIKTGDEIERLATEFNNMTDKLKESTESLGIKINVATRDLKSAHGEIEDKNAKLKEADRLKSQFLANMSHELRTPMNAIIGFTSLMEEEIYGKVNEKQKDALGKVGRNAQALLQLINDILDLSRIEAGKIVLSPSEFDLKLMVDEVIINLESLVRGKKFVVEKVLEDNITVFTDRNRLKQIVVNLLTNAIKFTEKGKITVSSGAGDAGMVEIKVADTGIGIKKEDLAFIFEEFRQVDGSSTRRHGGTGLGLSITRKLSNLLGGDIEAESEYNRGTTMMVSIPAKMSDGENEK